MDFLDTLHQRNQAFAADGFSSGLKMLPSQKTIIIGCVDPRVDPVDIFKLLPGEAVVIRNVGGRLNAATLETMAILRTVAEAAGQQLGTGWNLVVLHHNDCGIIGCYHHAPDLLSRHLGVSRTALDGMAIADPDAAVALDVAALKANPELPGGFMVSGLVYDVRTGLVKTVVPAGLLRENAD
ncbi:MAG: carbonic anhydrase [Rhodoferax sp.]|nr:carbonic anhydrase [Rhodoferax sp.]